MAASTTEDSSTDEKPSIEDIVNELDRIDTNIEGLFTLNSELRERVSELEAENERQQRTIESLRARVTSTDGDGQ